ncbi:SH3 domain-containing protein [Paraburkholderia monticola]|uniref:SH3 domain-containing protein n=1 Tax=Paraburkholderia monticola TaxID=1399968 RepID=UPI0007805250|nr:SH3 domain-containing protein [Paraburkholderia monticola]
MKRQVVVGFYVVAGLLTLPGAANAQSQAYTNSGTNVRAGPASDYPIVTQLPAGVPVSVMGCLSNYQWCDVAAPNLRGWVYASRLSSPYQGGYMPLNYGATLGLPILAFSIGDYWGNYYRGRPWYGQQSRWSHHAPPPPPRPGAGRPPPNYRPPQGHPGGRPPGHAGGRPPGGPPPGGPPPGNPGGRPPGNEGGRPPGGPPPGNAGGRPQGGPPPGHQGGPQGGGNRPQGGPSGGHQGGPQGGPPGGHQGGPQGGGGGGGGGQRPPGGGGNN